jgi:hypothetical protein
LQAAQTILARPFPARKGATGSALGSPGGQAGYDILLQQEGQHQRRDRPDFSARHHQPEIHPGGTNQLWVSMSPRFEGTRAVAADRSVIISNVLIEFSTKTTIYQPTCIRNIHELQPKPPFISPCIHNNHELIPAIRRKRSWLSIHYRSGRFKRNRLFGVHIKR